MRKIIHYLIMTFVLALGFTSCEKTFEFSPNEVRFTSNEKHQNKKNLDRLAEDSATNKIMRFVVISDTQNFYDDLKDAVSEINKEEDIDFVLHAGDITQYGIASDYKIVGKWLRRIHFPVIGVVGNHDVTGNGEEMFKSMFGQLNFSFRFKGHKFICYDSNSREHGFNGQVPNVSWIKEELDEVQEGEKVIMFSHIPPYDGDTDLELEPAMEQLLSSNPSIVLSIHGHLHKFKYWKPYMFDLNFLIADSMDKRTYLVVESDENGVRYERKKF